MWACKSILPGCKLCSRGWKHSGWTNQHPMRNHWRVWVWRPATPAISAFRLGATMAAPQEGSIDAAITSELWGLFHLKKSKEWHWGLSSIGEEVIALLATNLPTRSADSSALLSDRLKLSHDRQWLPSIFFIDCRPKQFLAEPFSVCETNHLMCQVSLWLLSFLDASVSSRSTSQHCHGAAKACYGYLLRACVLKSAASCCWKQGWESCKTQQNKPKKQLATTG